MDSIAPSSELSSASSRSRVPFWTCKGTSPIRNSAPLAPYSRPYGGPRGGGAVSYERGAPEVAHETESNHKNQSNNDYNSSSKTNQLKRQISVQIQSELQGVSRSRKIDVRLPGKGNSKSHGARPVHLIITMITWIRTSRLSIKNSLYVSC